MSRRSKWGPWQREAVSRYMGQGLPRTVAEVYRMLEKAHIVGSLTSGNIRAYLERNYIRRGKKTCSVSRRVVQCWGVPRGSSRGSRPSWDGSNKHVAESAKAYD